MSHKGKCTCGAVTFVAEGDPINIRACHCHQRQSAFSSPFFARALFEQAKVKVTGTTAAHLSSLRLSACSARSAEPDYGRVAPTAPSWELHYPPSKSATCSRQPSTSGCQKRLLGSSLMMVCPSIQNDRRACLRARGSRATGQSFNIDSRRIDSCLEPEP